MKREDFEAQVAAFVRVCTDDYGAKTTVKVEEEDEGEPTGFLTIKYDDEPEYHLELRVDTDNRNREETVAVLCGEDSLYPLTAGIFYAWLWLETVSRMRLGRQQIAGHVRLAADLGAKLVVAEKALAEKDAQLETRDRYWEDQLRDQRKRLEFDLAFQTAQARDGYRQFQEATGKLRAIRDAFAKYEARVADGALVSASIAYDEVREALGLAKPNRGQVPVVPVPVKLCHCGRALVGPPFGEYCEACQRKDGGT